jgi:flagellin
MKRGYYMIISHNINALKSLKKLNENNDKNTKSIEKISSGMRINRAAEDSAGLAISEKMRGQIQGLKQAERNIQDGISLIQTAEGGLGQIVNPHLQRIRELAIQAANDTLMPADRNSIQMEIEGILESIDGIANHTEFNSIKVLRPPVITTPPVTLSGKSDIVFIVDVSGSMGGTIDNVINNLDSFVDKLQLNKVDFNLGLVSYSDTYNGEPLMKWDFTNNSNDFKNNMSVMRANMLGGGDLNESGLEGIKDPSQGALSLPLRSDSSKQFILVTDAPVHDNYNGDGGDGRSIYDIEDVAAELFSKSIKLTVVGPLDSSASSQLQRLTVPTGGDYFNIMGDFSEQLNSFADKVIEDSNTTLDLESFQPIILQVGPNSDDTFTVDLFDARTHKLGLLDIRVDPFDKAIETLDKVDHAISIISRQRSKFGAYYNSLEHIYNNAVNAEVNLTSAESQIRDVDLAKEMMNQTKNSILSQTAQAMLAQSQQTPQGVLQLLR